MLHAHIHILMICCFLSSSFCVTIREPASENLKLSITYHDSNQLMQKPLLYCIALGNKSVPNFKEEVKDELLHPGSTSRAALSQAGLRCLSQSGRSSRRAYISNPKALPFALRLLLVCPVQVAKSLAHVLSLAPSRQSERGVFIMVFYSDYFQHRREW